MPVLSSSLADFVFQIADQADAASDLAALQVTVGEGFTVLGAPIFVGVEARTTSTGPDVAVRFGQTSPVWEAHYQASGHAKVDPIVRHMLGSAEPLYWSELEGAGPPLERGAQRVMSEARSFGLREGMVAPLHQPGGGVNAILLMGEGLDARDARQRRAATLLCAAFDRAARRLRLDSAGSARKAGPLSRRETQAIALLRGGASNKLIGKELGISQHTVADLLQSARRKLGARTRTDLAFMAHERGLLTAFLTPRCEPQARGQVGPEPAYA